ncbi:MAG: Hsp20/alpha crystallin family protein [Candidatus Cloacimonadales bacterium]
MSYIPLNSLGNFFPTQPRFIRYRVNDKAENENLKQRNLKLMPIDLIEREKSYQIKANLPGFSREEINLSLDQQVLVIEAKGTNSEPKQNYQYLQSERYKGNYQRRIALSEQCDLGKISAELSGGVLQISIPKIAEASSQKIEIN